MCFVFSELCGTHLNVQQERSLWLPLWPVSEGVESRYSVMVQVASCPSSWLAQLASILPSEKKLANVALMDLVFFLTN